VLSKYTPKGVEIDLFEEKAYVSLVGFMFKNTRLFNIPIFKFGTFEEINLRFYVKRTVEGKTKRGVVFINETVPYRVVAWLANTLYKEHYTTVKTRHTWEISDQKKKINYQWLLNNRWNSIEVTASTTKKKMEENSFEHFIYEHYYGYTKLNELETEEYRIAHPSWLINEINDYKIDCNFHEMYGKDFSFLDEKKPTSVFIAEGSSIEVQWKRNKI
jgi:uncharacterized protein